MHPRSEAEGRHETVRPSILVVNPGMAVSEAVTLVVSRRAHVLRATTGMEGLMIAAEHNVELVIADDQLPDLSSAEFLRLLHLLRPGVPVAILGADGPCRGSLGPAASAYFPGPIQLKRVLDWIAACFDWSPAPWTEAGPGVAEPRVRYEVPVRHLATIGWVVEFIERCYQDRTRFSDIARAAGVSRSHLCRIFKRVTGLSLNRFLTRYRLQAAKAMLRDRRTAIQQVASTVGYHDPSHFNRVFRQWEGQTPSLYRRQAVKGAPRTGGRGFTRDSPHQKPA